MCNYIPQNRAHSENAVFGSLTASHLSVCLHPRNVPWASDTAAGAYSCQTQLLSFSYQNTSSRQHKFLAFSWTPGAPPVFFNNMLMHVKNRCLLFLFMFPVGHRPECLRHLRLLSLSSVSGFILDVFLRLLLCDWQHSGERLPAVHESWDLFSVFYPVLMC